MPKKLDITGQRFGRLVALRVISEGRRPKWLCKCDCGGENIAIAGALRSGNPKSCGCLQREAAADLLRARATHGMAGHPLATMLHSMRQRCYYEKHISYPNYGGRGISICDEWRHDAAAFYRWALANGYAEGLTIERKDTNGNYEPANCKFATNKEQSNNRRSNRVVEFRGQRMTAAQFAEALGMNLTTVKYRLDAGWDCERIANSPVRKYGSRRGLAA